MSLINEALKKAQRQRSLDNAPLSSAPSSIAAAAVTTHVRAASHKRSHGALWFGLGLVALGAAATVLVMHYGFDSSESQKVAKSAPAVPPPATPSVTGATPGPAPFVPPPPPPVETVSAVVVLPPISQTSTPASSATPPPAVAATDAAPLPAIAPGPAPLPAPTPVAPVAPPLTPAEQQAQVYSFLNTIRLAGVRGVDREARVLMNERVWRLNDIVSPELGLRLSAVRPNLLVFTDAQGRTYEKPY